MEPFIALGFPLLAGGIFVISVLTRHRSLLDRWRALVAQHGLALLEASSIWSPRTHVTARSGTAEVRIERIPKRGTWIELAVPGLLGASGLRLRRETLLSWGREIEVGDTAFDQVFMIEGTPGLVTSLLDSPTRRLLLQLNAEGPFEIRDGMLRMRVTGGTLPRVLPHLIQLGQQLTQVADVVRRLAAMAREDPAPGVRLRSLLLLVREHPEAKATAETLRAACQDRDPEVRLRAAIERGKDGHPILAALAEGEAGDPLRAQAVTALGLELPLERTRALLLRCLRRRHVETARACVEILGRWRTAGVDSLLQVLGRETPDLAAAAAQALGVTGEATAEPALIQALQDGASEVRLAAAGSLGRIGSVAAVLPLQEAGEDDRDVRRAARQAIAEIQSRLQGASPGQLSLAQTEAGHLSLATDPAGQLSLPPQGRVPT